MSLVFHRPRTSWNLPVINGPSVWTEPWPDPVVERIGAPVRSDYTERFWLPVLGPTATWLLRYVDQRLETESEGFELHTAEAALAIGVSSSDGTKGPFSRALNRCVVFGLAQPIGDTLAVRRCVPPVPHNLLKRCAPPLEAAHTRWLSERSGDRRAE
jgi:hypothetical protein